MRNRTIESDIRDTEEAHFRLKMRLLSDHLVKEDPVATRWIKGNIIDTEARLVELRKKKGLSMEEFTYEYLAPEDQLLMVEEALRRMELRHSEVPECRWPSY